MIKSQYDPKKDILITVEGGIVQSVDLPSNCKIRVVLQDFDIEGTDENELVETPRGYECMEAIWEN